MLQSLFLTVHPLEFSGSGLEYDKQIIYVGTFTKGDVKFSVDEKLIEHWVKESSVMITRGFKIKLPVEHTFDPEKNRGHVLMLSKRLDSKGRVSLWAKMQFIDAESAKLAASTDVSIYSPPYYQMGDGYIANRPITHVALTDYPVVPGLEPFETIAASLTEDTRMPLKDLAEQLGITVPDGADDTAIAELIVSEFAKLKDKPKEDPKPDDPPKPDEAMAASMTRLMLDARSAKIDGLVLARKLSPAEATAWKKQYCNAETISLSKMDEFDTPFALAQQRQAMFETKEQTGRQVLDSTNNPLLKDAERRKKATV